MAWRGAPEGLHVSKRHAWGRRTSAVAALTALSFSASTLLAQPATPPPNPAPPKEKPAASPPAEAASPPAEAASPPTEEETLRAQAAARKKSGDEAMESFRFADALAAYNDAYAITKDVVLLYNMGRALQALNRFPEALDKLEAFDQAASAELKARVPRLPKLITELRQRVSTLTIKTNVEGARVVVRNTILGKAPLAGPVRLTAGAAEIEIDAEGYFTGKKSVDLPGGSGITVDLPLFSKATTGVLLVNASAKGAEVLIDGKRIGVAPLEINVSKGPHRVTFRHPDFRLYETRTIVEAGRTKRIDAALQPVSILTRWWFWTGVGVVAATGAAFAIAAVSSRAADLGTIAPGQIPIPSPPEGSPMVISF
jgi:hypothetical protein